ncbi:hypothetical protein EUGRSUZ_F00688 [Eucalyptus grandis]|uniref:Uncharacterized protein n=2 Tax=Eucalyptus grandis TaxID=71139 RepID=A0ACC3KC86_EUCGR|nr:hypothetical protein EUGRSUZ_F00688 [Eucalyptus grandis]
MGWHQILCLLSFHFCLLSSLRFALPLCPPDQHDALLHFKNSFMLDSKASNPCWWQSGDSFYQKIHLVKSYPKMNSWYKGMDCCLWDGVACDDAISNVIGLDLTCSWLRGTLYSNSSLFLLRHLRNLNLSGNIFFDSHISSNLSAFATLTHLNLSGSFFSGSIPSEISCLSKFVSLDLSNKHFYGGLSLENSIFTMLVQNLTTLRKLVLEEVYMSMVSLNVGSCSLGGIFPDAIFRLPSLTTLYLFFNRNLSRILPKSNWTSPLESLSLWRTSFSGEIPDSIGNMKNLTVLDLENCKFTRHIPSSIWNLNQLQVLYINRNSFCGVVEFELFTKFKNLRIPFVSHELNLIYDTLEYTFPKLEILGLYSCNLTKLPYFLNSLKRLTYLDLSSNRIGGEIPMWFWGVSHDTLEWLDLSNNLLEGGIQLLNDSTNEIPSSICQFSSLQYLELSNNNFSRNMPLCLVKCVNLSMLALSHNNLDLQSNKFHGRIDLTAFGLSFPALENLFISNNNFIGQWPTEFFSNTSLGIIDLSNNKFGGPIPLPSPVTYYYSIASNNITGKIPSLICNATWLEIIDLSNNSLIGSLPRCLTNFSTNLLALNLRMNRLEGTIPEYFSSRSGLMTLDLSRNQFEGTLPHVLVKCRYLEVLDLSHNQIEDTFPRWLGSLPELKVLVLRSNNLKDLLDIPRGAHLFPKLHILDLYNNSFSDPLPTNLIMNLKGMMNSEDMQNTSLYMTRSFGSGTYENSVAVMMKGLEVELVRILTFLTIIDLSCNSFQGNIPKVIGHLHFLVGLNLSHNHLTGSIPLTLGNLTNLEWLDLSLNKFSGLIPRKLGDLASLGYLKLSKNQLTGRIPQDKQLSTFSSNSFSGNPGLCLCGTPLPKACLGDAQPPPPSSLLTFNRGGHERWLKQKTMWIGYASGIVIGISIAYIAFDMGRPKWLLQGVRMLESRAVEWIEKSKRKAIKFHGQ